MIHYISTLANPDEVHKILELHFKEILKNANTICYIKYLEKFLLVVKILDFTASKDLITLLNDYKPIIEITKLVAKYSLDDIYKNVYQQILTEIEEIKDILTDADWEVN